MTTSGDISVAQADEFCAGEPIHIPGSIQPHGVLLGFDPTDGTIRVASLGASAALGTSCLGRQLSEVVGETLAAAWTKRALDGELDPGLPWEYTVEIAAGSFDVAAHLHDGLVILEFEAAHSSSDGDARAIARLLQRAIGRLRACSGGVEDLAGIAVEAIRAISDYERVLVYRFDRDWHGVAIAETKAADWDQSFLGLRFPASDIPRQARELYARSPMRWVPMRDYRPVRLETTAGFRGGKPIDLSFARLRSLSPVTPSISPQHERRRHHVGIGAARRSALGPRCVPSPRSASAVDRGESGDCGFDRCLRIAPRPDGEE